MGFASDANLLNATTSTTAKESTTKTTTTATEPGIGTTPIAGTERPAVSVATTAATTTAAFPSFFVDSFDKFFSGTSRNCRASE
jgi:hypothetical protein